MRPAETVLRPSVAQSNGRADAGEATGLQAKIAPVNVARMKRNYSIFESYVDRAERCLARSDLEAAAGYALLAAWVAAHMHCGFFASPRVERLLTTIGRRMTSALPSAAHKRTSDPVKRVLHITGEVHSVGGLATMLRRWIESDPGRHHSVALTQQFGAPPSNFVDTVSKAAGEIHHLSHAGGLEAKVAELRRIAVGYDLIVLHIPNSDVVPSIAFADPKLFPPILFLNHSDHMFWIGSAISQVVGSMRDAALEISEKRRYIEKQRNLLVPILVSPTVRSQDRAAAKAALGLDPDGVLLVSVARAQKYRTLDGVSYADTHVPLLKKYQNATLIVVGGGDRPDWAEASAAVGGRIQSLTPRSPQPYLEAADIYLDSFPFCSATSMMEAAGYGLPCVSRFVMPREARICGMDHPGLAGPLLESTNDVDYLASLERLIPDPDMRARVGADTERSVRDANVSPGWNAYLEAAIARAVELPPVDPDAVFASHETEQIHFGEPDIRLEDIYGFSPPQIQVLRYHLDLFPLGERLRLWREVARAGGFEGRKEALRSLLPRWLIMRIRGLRSRTLKTG